MRGIWCVLVEQPGLFSPTATKRADVIEQIDEQEHEDDLRRTRSASAAPDIELCPPVRREIGQAGKAGGDHFATPVTSPIAVVVRIPDEHRRADPARQQRRESAAIRRSRARCSWS